MEMVGEKLTSSPLQWQSRCVWVTECFTDKAFS